MPNMVLLSTLKMFFRFYTLLNCIGIPPVGGATLSKPVSITISNCKLLNTTTTEAPTTKEPTTAAPTIVEHTTQEPDTVEPYTVEPGTEEPDTVSTSGGRGEII